MKLMKTLWKTPVSSAFPASCGDAESVRGCRAAAHCRFGTAERLALVQIPVWSPGFIPSGFFLF